MTRHTLRVTVDDNGITIERPIWLWGGRMVTEYVRSGAKGARAELEAAKEDHAEAIRHIEAMLDFLSEED
jgi:hypothetical protein